MSEILLVFPGNCNKFTRVNSHLPLSILSLAAWLRNHDKASGDKITIADMNVRDIGDFELSGARVVGISAMTGNQIRYGLGFAAAVKKVNPSAYIVWGGIHPTLMPEQTISSGLVDCVVIGEGEQAFSEICDRVLSGKPVAGIMGTCVMDETGSAVIEPARPFIDLEELPLPAYDLIDLDNYPGVLDRFDYQTSRGCPFRCAFCYNVRFCGRKWRRKSPEKSVREMNALAKEYGVRCFGLVDDEFFIDLRRVNSIVEGILESGMRYSISASCRLDIISRCHPELLAKLKLIGVKRMYLGAESGSDGTLEMIKKDISVDDVLKGSLKVSKSGITAYLSFMGGFPGETEAAFTETIDLAMRLSSMHPGICINGIFPYNPYPGSEMYERAINSGFEPPDSLEAWGNWEFQYSPTHPWIPSTFKDALKTSFYIMRFSYYLKRLQEINCLFGRVAEILLLPILLDGWLRLKYRYFKHSYEWDIFARIASWTFGYL